MILYKLAEFIVRVKDNPADGGQATTLCKWFYSAGNRFTVQIGYWKWRREYEKTEVEKAVP